MARTAHMQFNFLTRDEAVAYLAKFEGPNGVPRSAENYGDRVMAQRRVELPAPPSLSPAQMLERYPPGRHYPSPFTHRG